MRKLNPDLGLDGAATIARIRKQTDTIVLAFSCGKDAIATWLECRKHFSRIVPYYMYLVPDLEFVEQSVRYYEEFFGQRIYRIPHPSLYRWINEGVFQPPNRIRVINRTGLPDFDYLDIQDELRKDLGLSSDCYTASGVRAADSPYRLISIKTHGSISHGKRQFFPIWDWKMDQLIAEIQAAGVHLPVDYRMFGRSFDGLDYRFLEPIKRHFPRDFERILEWFPLADIEIARRQYAH